MTPEQTMPLQKQFHIYEIGQIGNIGPHEIERYQPRASGAVKQPSIGFKTMQDAENFIQIYDVKPLYQWHQLTILPIYIKVETI